MIQAGRSGLLLVFNGKEIQSVVNRVVGLFLTEWIKHERKSHAQMHRIEVKAYAGPVSLDQKKEKL